MKIRYETRVCRVPGAGLEAIHSWGMSPQYHSEVGPQVSTDYYLSRHQLGAWRYED